MASKLLFSSTFPVTSYIKAQGQLEQEQPQGQVLGNDKISPLASSIDEVNPEGGDI